MVELEKQYKLKMKEFKEEMIEKCNKEKMELELNFIKQIEELKVFNVSIIKVYEEKIVGIKEKFEKKLVDLEVVMESYEERYKDKI